jgi:hypothetical protein
MTDTASTTQATPATLSGRIATWVTALLGVDARRDG